MALPKKNRLSPARDVAKALRGRAMSQTEHFALKVRSDGKAGTRLAVVVPSKVISHATDRNAARRRVSEAVRPLISHMRALVGAVIIVRRADMPHGTGLQEELTQLLQKSDMLRQ